MIPFHGWKACCLNVFHWTRLDDKETINMKNFSGSSRTSVAQNYISVSLVLRQKFYFCVLLFIVGWLGGGVQRCPRHRKTRKNHCTSWFCTFRNISKIQSRTKPKGHGPIPCRPNFPVIWFDGVLRKFSTSRRREHSVAGSQPSHVCIICLAASETSTYPCDQLLGKLPEI